MNWDESASWERELEMYLVLVRIAKALEENNKRIESNEDMAERLTEYRAKHK